MVKIYKKRGIRSEFKKIYIFCEGEKTEPLYFSGFRDEIHNAIKRKPTKRRT